MHFTVGPVLALLALTRAAAAAPTPNIIPDIFKGLNLFGALAGPEGEVAEISVEAIVDVVNEVVDFIKGIDQLIHQDDAETKYTQSTISKLAAKYPNKNVLVYTDVNSGSNLAGATCADHDFDIGLGFTKGYRHCVFDSGSFDRAGDGGYVNWAFQGNYKRDGGSSHVDFFPIGASQPGKKRDTAHSAVTYDWSSQPGNNHTHIPLQTPVVYSPPFMSGVMLPPNEPTCVKPVDDGTYLLSCHAGNGTTALGLGYYKSVVPHGGNKGQQPDDFVLLVETTPKSNTPATYGNGTAAATAHNAWRFPVGAMQFADKQSPFHWSIFGNSIADTVAVEQTAGFANDGSDFFWIYKDDGKDLFTKDSWTCASLYYAM